METISLEQALDCVRAGTLSQSAAARLCNVSRFLIYDRLKGIRREKPGASARKSNDAEETYIANLILKCADNGVPVTKSMLKRIVAALAAEKDMPNNKQHFPDRWHRQFLQRHPLVSQRISHAVNRKKAREWTAETRDGWVNLLSGLHVDGLLDDPNGVWNFDESAFQVAERVSFVYARRGVKEVLSYYDGNDREMITVLAGGNAAGQILRPLVLFDGSVFLGSRFDGTDDNCHISFNPSGFMDCATFSSYIREEVIPAMTAEKNVIFLDGHSSHMFNLECLLECMKSDKNITVVILPAGQTDKLQPMDLKVYGPVKKYWRQFLRERSLAVAQEVTKQSFARHVMHKWNDFNMGQNIVSGFRAAGIFPFDPQMVCEAFPEPILKENVEKDVCPSIETVYSTELAETRSALRKIPILDESSINRIIRFAVKEVNRMPQVESPEDFALSFRTQVIGAHSFKRRVLKDTRLQAKSGTIATATKYIEALKEREAKKQKKPQKKRPRAGLADVTNIPPKKRAGKRVGG